VRTLDLSQRAGRPIAITIGSRPGAEYAGLSDREIMEDVDGKVRAVSAFVRLHDPDIVFSIAGFLVEAQTLGVEVILPDYGSPAVGLRPLENSTDLSLLRTDEPPESFMLCRNLVESIRVLSSMYPDRPVAASIAGPVTVASQLIGVERMLVQSVEAPAFLLEVMELVTDRVNQVMNLQLQAGAGYLNVADPVSSLLSPGSFARFSFPFLERLFSTVEVPNHLHICGNTNNHLAHLAATSAHAVSVDTGVDMKKAARLFGPDRAVCGQLDSAGVLSRGRPADVAKATETMMEEMAPFPNYIPSTSCGMPRKTPPKNIQAFYGTVRGRSA
jgi:uroporphyrinogen decarboxylase